MNKRFEKFEEKVNLATERIDQFVTKQYQQFDRQVAKYSIRRVVLAVSIILFVLGTSFTAFGTFSSSYTIERVTFSNEKYVQKAIEFGSIYQPLNVSLVPDEPMVAGVSAYIITPTGRPAGYKFPTIIWSHGMVVNSEFQLHYALEMAYAGFKVIAINLDGHGSSGGLWSIGLTNAITFWTAVDYAAKLSDVNTSAIVVSGHSNGGYAAARAGLFDKTPLGTGGLIKAVGSMWTVSNMSETFVELVGWGNPTSNPAYSWLIPMFIGVNAPAIEPEDLLRRSISDYVNETNMPNWFVISGEKDQMSSPTIQYNAMAAAVNSQASFETIKTTVESYWTHDRYGYWNNLANPNISFTNGTARQIGIVKGMDHAGEAMDPIMVQKTVEWFRLALDLNPDQFPTRIEAGKDVMLYWTFRLLGWFILLFAMILSQFYFIVALSPKFFPEKYRKYEYIEEKDSKPTVGKIEQEGFIPPGLDEFLVEVRENTPRDLVKRFALTWRKKLRFFFGLMLCLAAGVAMFFLILPPPITPIWIFNGYLWMYFFAGSVTWAYALWVLIKYRKSKFYGPFVSLKRVGGSWDGFIRGFIFTGIVVLVPVTIYNLVCYDLFMPILFPRPHATGIWYYVFLGAAMIWVLYLPFEVLVKTQLFARVRKFESKTGYWMEILSNAIFVFFIWAFGYLIGASFMNPTLWGMVFLGDGFGGTLFFMINFLMFAVNGAFTFVTALIYQRTRNLFACSFYPVLMAITIIFGKAVGIYAIF